MALKKLAAIFANKASRKTTKDIMVQSSKPTEVTPSQRVDAPDQRVGAPLQQVTPRQKVILDQAIQRVNLKKRRKKLANKLVKVIRHRLSKYRSPVKKKKEVLTTSTYSLRNRKKQISYNGKL